MEAAAVTKSLPEKCNKFITTDSQARELAKVEPEHRVEVLERAAEAGPVTAKAIPDNSRQLWLNCSHLLASLKCENANKYGISLEMQNSSIGFDSR